MKRSSALLVLSAMVLPVTATASPIEGTWKDMGPVAVAPSSAIDYAALSFESQHALYWVIGATALRSAEVYGVNEIFYDASQYGRPPSPYRIVGGDTLIVTEGQGSSATDFTFKFRLADDELDLCEQSIAGYCSEPGQFEKFVRTNDVLLAREGKHALPQFAAHVTVTYGDEHALEFDLFPPELSGLLPDDFLDPIRKNAFFEASAGGVGIFLKFAMLGSDASNMSSYFLTYTFFGSGQNDVVQSPVMQVSVYPPLEFTAVVDGKSISVKTDIAVPMR